MAPLLSSFRAEDLRDAIVACHLGVLSEREAPQRYRVPTRALRNSLMDLEAINTVRVLSRQQELVENNDRHQVYRWASNYANAKMPEERRNAKQEIHDALLAGVKGGTKVADILEEYGLSNTTYFRRVRLLLKELGISTLKKARESYKAGALVNTTLIIAISRVTEQKRGRPTYLTADEEALIVASAEIKAAHAQPVSHKRLAVQIDRVLDALPATSRKKPSSTLASKSNLKYARRMIRRVNEKEPGMEGQKRRSKTGEIKVAGLSNKRAKQSDPRLAWAMFHSICAMYRDAKRARDKFFRDATEQFKNAVEDDILGPKAVRPNIPALCEPITDTTTTELQMEVELTATELQLCESITDTTKELQMEAEPTATELQLCDPITDTTTELQIEAEPTAAELQARKGLIVTRTPMVVPREEMLASLSKLRTIPDDFAEIQPRADQVWNCDEVGIDPNGKWYKIVCTFKWCMTEKLWKTQTGERSPFWCSFLFFSRADGQCFIAPTVIHQGTELTADFLLNLPGNWIVHTTPSGYMDRDGWYKTINNFAHMSGASESNKQFLYFDGHDSHWDSDALELLENKHIQSFFLKSGDSEKDQPNDNGPNACVKSCYNDAKADWDEKFATTNYTVPHMNGVLTDMWNRYVIRSAPVIKRSFAVTKIHPLQPPSADNEQASHAFTASLQCAGGKKAMELEHIGREALAPIKLNISLTVEPTVILHAKQCTSRNLVIRAAAYDIVRASLVVPVQEMKRITHEHAAAKNIRIGSSEVQQETRMNPDSSRGLYVTTELRAKARAVQEAKEKKKALDKSRKVDNDVKQRELATKKQEAFDRLRFTIEQSLSLRSGLCKHSPATDLKLVYQHVGGKVANLPNGKRETFISLLESSDNMRAIKCRVADAENTVVN